MKVICYQEERGLGEVLLQETEGEEIKQNREQKI